MYQVILFSTKYKFNWWLPTKPNKKSTPQIQYQLLILQVTLQTIEPIQCNRITNYAVKSSPFWLQLQFFVGFGQASELQSVHVYIPRFSELYGVVVVSASVVPRLRLLLCGLLDLARKGETYGIYRSPGARRGY
jgi:hypothetical protein